MTGLLVVAGALALVIGVFVVLFRRRVQANLQRAGHALPAELANHLAPAARRAPAGGSRSGPAGGLASASPAASAPGRAPHFLLIYEVGPDFARRRAQHRDEHLALAWKAASAGELVLAGALEDEADQAILLFRGSREFASRFAQADPYVRNGLVRAWRVRQWHTVVGSAAAEPVRPAGL